MADATTKPKPAAEPPAADAPRQQTDGFHLVVEALKLNGVDTIFGVAGIPITDLLRLALELDPALCDA